MTHLDMTGYPLAAATCNSAAEVLARAHKVHELRRASRIKIEPEIKVAPPPPAPPPIPKVRGVLDYSAWPAWVNDFVHGVEPVASNVIEATFPIANPFGVHGAYPRIDVIIRIVAKFYLVNVIDILSDRRTANIVRPRQVAAYLCKTLTPRSLPEIGRRFGGRDHTTILHAVRKIERLIGEDQRLADECELLRIKISEHMTKPNEAAAPE